MILSEILSGLKNCCTPCFLRMLICFSISKFIALSKSIEQNIGAKDRLKSSVCPFHLGLLSTDREFIHWIHANSFSSFYSITMKYPVVFHNIIVLGMCNSRTWLSVLGKIIMQLFKMLFIIAQTIVIW